jgi:hypothetical protein
MNQEEQLLAELQQTVYLSIASGSPNIDRFSEWTLAGTGAVLGVIIANLESTTAHISLCSLRWAVAFLVASAVFAGLQKIFATGVRSGAEAYQKAMPKILAIARLPAAQTISPERLRESLIKPFWWPLRQIIGRAMRSGETDLIYGSKIPIFLFQLQGLANLLQLICVLVSFILLLCGLR